MIGKLLNCSLGRAYRQYMSDEKKQCKVDFYNDPILGWKITPGPGCEEVLKAVHESQGPHSQRYLDVRTDPTPATKPVDTANNEPQE